MKVIRDDIGKSVLVKFDDVGRVEGVLIDVVRAPNSNFRRATIFFPYDNTIDDVEFGQIVEVGKRIKFFA